MYRTHRATLGDADLRMITLEVMKTHPLLASSPGMKHVDVYRGYGVSNGNGDSKTSSILQANGVFHPHSETAGVRNALQAHCSREPASADWACPVVELRRYVRLEDQDFEVRVKGDLSLEAILRSETAGRRLSIRKNRRFTDRIEMSRRGNPRGFLYPVAC